jgi:23S rRNA (adenine2503-C2)-methyltransferase
MKSETVEPLHLLDAALDEFTSYCADRKLPDYRAKQVFEWVYTRNVRRFADMTNLAKPLREELARDWAIDTATEHRRQKAADGTIKLLLAWPDQATSECVLIADGRRRTACVSSQVGCPVGCAFCASGMAGLQRNLTTGQIVEQVLRIRDLIAPPQDHIQDTPSDSPDETIRSRLSNIVFMGLGEPLLNYNSVLKAIRIINAPWGLNIGARNLTVSTVGLPRQIRRLADEGLQINLAISLHAPTDELRRQLIPWAGKIPLQELIEAGRYFFEKTGREVTLEYLLLAGVNDHTEHAYDLVRVCRKMRCNVNLIRYNPVPSLPFERPDTYAAHRFVECLRQRGVNAHVRRSRGLDIEAACGQLRRATR